MDDAAPIKTKADTEAVKQGCYFDLKEALKVKAFLEKFCVLSKGKWAGKPFRLLDWQWDEVIKPLFGWRKKDGTRRFNFCSMWIAKKNGKSSLLSALSNYFNFADNEQGAENYVIANSVGQANLIFAEALAMMKAHPALRKRIKPKESIKYVALPDSKSFYRVISTDRASKDGYNTHFLAYDEFAFAKDRELWAAFKYSGIAREQSLIFTISTAGTSRESIGYEVFREGEKILSGESTRTDFLPIHFYLDDSDDWTDSKLWIKANPSLGQTIKLQEMKASYEAAKQNASDLAEFRMYRLNQWIGSSQQWINLFDWAKCAEPYTEESLLGKPCYVGLDLARKNDTAAYCLVFQENNKYRVIPRIFIPQVNAEKLSAKTKQPFLRWAETGLVIATDGDVISYDVIKKHLLEDAGKYQIQELRFDPYNAEQLVQQLENSGIFCVEFKQHFHLFAAPSKEFELAIKEQRFLHPSNPAFNFQLESVKLRIDADLNAFPSKKLSSGKIDSIMATIMGLSGWLANQNPSEFFFSVG